MRKRVIRAIILLAIAVAAGVGAATAAGAIGAHPNISHSNDSTVWD
jgi:hypothetical protein